MADYGIKITKAGQDVATAADKDLVWSSKYNGMKIKKHDTRATAGSVAHGLGYVPTFLNFVESSGQYRLEYDYNETYIDATNIVFADVNNFYFIFVDRG